jgi:hypothetical protein
VPSVDTGRADVRRRQIARLGECTRSAIRTTPSPMNTWPSMSGTVDLSVQDDVSLICRPTTSLTRMSPCWWASTAFEPWPRNNSARRRRAPTPGIARPAPISAGHHSLRSHRCRRSGNPAAGLPAFGFVPKTVGTVRDRRCQTVHRPTRRSACEDLALGGRGFPVPLALRRGSR